MHNSQYPHFQENLSSLGVHGPIHAQQMGSWYNPTTWFGGKKKKGKGKASALEDLATNVGKQAAKTATTQATKKAAGVIKSKTGVDVSSKDLTSAAKDISKGNISKAATNIGTKVASQAVSKYGAKATTQLSQLTAQYTSALDVPQSSNVGSQSNALMYQSSVPMTANAADSSSSSNDTSSQKETGLSTGAMVGIGVGVLGILGVGGYLLWSAKANKKQKSYGESDAQIQQQRALQYQNLQAINNPKAKKSKAKKSKAKKSKAKSCR